MSRIKANNSPYSSPSAQGGGDTVMDSTGRVTLSTPWRLEQQQWSDCHIPTTHGNPCHQRVQNNRPVYPSPNLHRIDTPFMHLEELCLVFCVGISNSDFNALFRSFRGSSLRLLNLQFTNIEDTCLETLARVFGDTQSALTAIKLSYCSKITSRGIRAIVERCPQLLELDFLGCDQVSADCFRGPTPWRCTGLRQLEFTLRPKVMLERRRHIKVDGATPQRHLTADPDMVLTQETLQVHDNQQQQMDQLGNENDLSGAMEEQGQLAGDIDGDEDGLQVLELESVQRDYHAMFKQLGKLTELRSLHIYNSPALNNNTDSDNGYQDEPPAPWTPQGATSATPEESPVSLGSLPATSDYPNFQQGSESVLGNSELHDGVMVRTSVRRSMDSRYIAMPRQTEETDHESLPMDVGPLQPQLASSPAPVLGQLMRVSKPVPVHPFSMRMGLKSLQRLKNMQTLTLYERSTISLNRPEVQLIGRIFPELSELRLCGAIEVPCHVLERFQSKRPRVHVHVCPLFE